MMNWTWIIFGAITFIFALIAYRRSEKIDNDDDNINLEIAKWLFAYIVFVLIWVGVMLL